MRRRRGFVDGASIQKLTGTSATHHRDSRGHRFGNVAISLGRWGTQRPNHREKKWPGAPVAQCVRISNSEERDEEKKTGANSVILNNVKMYFYFFSGKAKFSSRHSEHTALQKRTGKKIHNVRMSLQDWRNRWKMLATWKYQIRRSLSSHLVEE